MKTKSSKISTLFFLSILISFNAYSQWKNPDAETIENDVLIIYDVEYDRLLSEKEKQSPRFKKEIIMVFNNNKLKKKTFSNINNYETFVLFDYDEEVSYECSKIDNIGNAIRTEFMNPKKETILQEGKEETILGLPCQVWTTKIKGQDREIYTTNKFGLKYIDIYTAEGFLMKYVAGDKYLGPYTVTAKNIFYTDKVDEKLYSLDGFKIISRAEHKENLKKNKERNNLAFEKALEAIGKSAPKYSARSLNGKKLKSKDMVGKVVVLNFWFTTSPSCKEKIPQLNELREKFKGENVEFIAVALDAEYKLSPFLEQHPFTYDIVEDGRWIAEKFEIKLYPSNIIIDQNGTIQFYKIGHKKDLTEMMSYEIEKLLDQ